MNIQIKHQKGATAIEYVIIIALIAVLVITNFDTLKGAISGSATTSSAPAEEANVAVADSAEPAMPDAPQEEAPAIPAPAAQ
jgi:Flp pilus assembly pilin Flp